MEELCSACMCKGRILKLIGGTGYYHLYIQILNEIQVYETAPLAIRVCWECLAVLQKWLQFKDTVKRSYSTLQYVVQNNSSDREPEPSRLQICPVLSDSYPKPIKIEDDDSHSSLESDQLDFIKEETHYEPETFVNSLSVEPKRRKWDKKKVFKKTCISEQQDRATDVIDNSEFLKTEAEEGTSLGSDRLEGIKEETHCEPETFVNNLSVEPKRRRKKVEKPIKSQAKKDTKSKSEKIPIKKKIKVKKKRTTSPDSIHAIDNHYTDNEDINDAAEPETKDLDKDKAVSLLQKRGVVNGSAAKVKEVLPERPHCADCGKNFSSKKTYRYHLNVLHKGQNRYPCPRCGKVYQWKSNLGRHLRSHKARDSGELYCATCDKRFASVATFRQHLRVTKTHVPESDFSFMCNVCGKKFVNKTRLRDHIDWEHLKNIKFRCQLCNKPFKCHTSLYVHMQNVHGDKDKKENLCHVCGKSYQNPAKLKYHIVAMHTSETPYRCAHCAAAFGWYSSLYRHVREVHYKMKLQPKKSKKSKKLDIVAPLPTQVAVPASMIQQAPQ